MRMIIYAICSSGKMTHIAGESSHVAPTGGTIEARFVLTVVKLGLTVTACVIWGTFAVVRVASIDTVSTMVAKLICLESYVRECWPLSRRRSCLYRICKIKSYAILYTSLSGSNFTRHSWDVTIKTWPASQTVTCEGGIFLSAATTILAWVRRPAPINWILKER